MTHLVDERSGRTYPFDALRWRAGDGTPLQVAGVPGIGRDDIETGEPSLWRYRAALPFGIEKPVSLGEGRTPLLARTWNGTDVLFKPEWYGPTGSFKDRGATVMISALARHGVREVVEDSSGNGGAAVSAYCAAAGIRARILAPEGTSPAKVLQSRAYGADVELVPGGRDATAAEAVRRSAEVPYAGHNWHPLFLQGTKTLAYELWEDLGFTAPDCVVTVAGAGSTVLGLDAGFGELLAAGQIRRRPRILAAQPANCAPIHASFRAGADGPVPTDFAPTVAEGTAIREPVRLPEVLRAVRRSGGDMAAIGEDAIRAAVAGLAALGLYAEPTSATAAAAVDVFRARGAVRPGETTAVLLTGTGLKAAPVMAEVFGNGTAGSGKAADGTFGGGA